MAFSSSASANTCRLERVAEVPMSVTKSGQAVVPVEINGIPVKMAIDTAGSLPIIYAGATEALNLVPIQSIRRGALHAGPTSLTQTVRIGSLKMTNVDWGETHALVYPLNRQFSRPLDEDDVVGSLGQNLFSGVDVELDFAANKLRLYSQKHCPGEVVYWSNSFDVLPLQADGLRDTYIPVMVNGKPMLASISSMSPVSMMEEEAAKKVLGLDSSSAGVDASGGSDGCTFCRSITLKAQGLEVKNARVKMVHTVAPGCHFIEAGIFGKPASYDCAGAYPFHLGMNVLTTLHLYFANGEKKLYFTGAKATVENAGAEPVAAVPDAH